MEKNALEKISFAKIKDVLSRYEMRSIMAGSGGGGGGGCPSCTINGATMGCYTQTVNGRTGCRCGLQGNSSASNFWC